MGYICLPWRRQPTGPARINWRNPITRGLIMAVVGKTGKDLVSGSLGYGANASAIDVALTGATIDTMGANSATNLTHSAPFYGRTGGIPSDPGQFTFLQWRKHLVSGSYGTSNIGGWVNSGGNAFRLGIRYSTANFYPAAGNAAMEVGSTLKDDLWHMLGVSLGNGQAGAWIDGVRRASASSVATPSFNLTASYDIFQLPSSPLSLLFERELSVTEQLSLYRDPWQVFEPEWVWVGDSAPAQQDAVAPGATMSAAAVLLAGAAFASSAATGSTLSAAGLVLAGAARADSSAPGAELACAASLLPGTASGTASGTAPGATVACTVDLVPGQAAADSTAPGAVLATTVSLIAGLATGTAGGTAPGATVTVAAAVVAGAATASSTAPGAQVQAQAELQPGSASGAASGTAPGALCVVTASLIAGAASGSSAGTAPGALLLVHANLLAGGIAADAQAQGVVLAAAAALLPGRADNGSGLTDPAERIDIPMPRRSWTIQPPRRNWTFRPKRTP